MGNLATKCFDAFSKDKIFDIDKKDEDKENKENISTSDKIKTNKRNNILNIEDIIDKSKSITYNKKRINDDSIDSIDIEKIIKIQNSYHKRYLQNKFQTEIKPSITKKTKEYIIYINNFI